MGGIVVLCICVALLQNKYIFTYVFICMDMRIHKTVLYSLVWQKDSPLSHPVITTSWDFRQCPPENECLNGHHDCDTRSQFCIGKIYAF